MRKWMDGMNAQAMDKWMTDLRSGEFNQAYEVLASTTGNAGFCCLGVATETNQEACGLTSKVSGRRVNYSWADEDGDLLNATSTLMPRPVAQFLGIPWNYVDDMGPEVSVYLKAHEGEYDYINGYASSKLGVEVVSATTLNDEINLSFAEIADRFEETFMVEVSE